VIAVADAHGELIGLLRMDGAPLPSILIASNKAWTAARERKASWELGQAARDSQTGFDIAYFGDSRYVGWGGGLPVCVGGAVVGVGAISGLAEGEDIELAEIGVAVITTLRASPQNTSVLQDLPETPLDRGARHGLNRR
jgi:glc operon protein GlcG